jgi:prepilin-type N-terminal cleavage/methylation domain-containing protein
MIKRKQQPKNRLYSESGFTIIESLVAIVVAGILLAAIAPVIVLSTATRVQSRRVELATRTAKSYIDGVKTGAIPPPTPPVVLTPNSTTLDGYLFDISKVPVPTAITNLYCVDSKNGNSTTCDATQPAQFAIQAFSSASSASDVTNGNGYHLGLRVYRSDAFKDSTPLTASSSSTANDTQTQQTFTGGGGNRKAPLIEISTDINTSSTTYESLCSRLGSASGTCN